MKALGFTIRQIAITTIGFTVVAVSADVGAAAAAGHAGVGGLFRIAAATTAWAAVVGAMACACLAATAWAVSLPFTDPKWRLSRAAWGAALPVMMAFIFGVRALLSGHGISAKPWIGFARVAAFLFIAIALTVFSYLALWILWTAQPGRPFWLRRWLVAGCVTVIPVALVLDRTVYPVLYPAAHAMLWLAIFVSVFLIAVIPARVARGATGALGGMLALLLVASVVLLFVDPLASSAPGRAAAYGDTLFLKRALTHLKPAPADEPLAADPAIIALLRSSPALDAAVLDRALPDRRRMNVVVISIDALRPDRLGRSGYRRNLTPNLDALLARGCVFENAWTTYPFTIMAFSSAFAGVYASGTDAYRNLELGLDKDPGNQPTIASILGAAGWRTEAVVGFPRYVRLALEREAGFQRFNVKADRATRDRDLVAEEIATLAIDALDHDPGRPFLLWVHFFDPHAPYSPPGAHPFGEQYADLYDAEILYTDRELGRFLGAVRSRGLEENTAFVVFSDHGEDLVERDHGTAVTEEQIQVPLAVILPRIPGRAIRTAVDLSDLAPTILELVGQEKRPELHGQSLLPCVLLDPATASAASFPPDLAFCELGCAQLPHPRLFAAREGAMKIIYHAASQTYSLYDLAADPKEKRDLAQVAPDVLARMKRVLDSYRAVAKSGAPDTRSKPDSARVPK